MALEGLGLAAPVVLEMLQQLQVHQVRGRGVVGGAAQHMGDFEFWVHRCGKAFG